MQFLKHHNNKREAVVLIFSVVFISGGPYNFSGRWTITESYVSGFTTRHSNASWLLRSLNSHSGICYSVISAFPFTPNKNEIIYTDKLWLLQYTTIKANIQYNSIFQYFNSSLFPLNFLSQWIFNHCLQEHEK